MKAKYRYFVSDATKQAIQFLGNDGYWQHRKDYFGKFTAKNRTSLPLRYFESSNHQYEVNRKVFLAKARFFRSLGM